jgi:hypothetical protein
MPLSTGTSDDAPQWYWAAADTRTKEDGSDFERADERFVIAAGQRELWSRVRREINPKEKCSWMSFGPKDGKATLADCFGVFISSREMYGASYNRLVLELAQVPAFATFIKERPSDLGNWISNPVTYAPLPRDRYDQEVETKLGRKIAATLNLDEEWWR